MKAAIQVQNLTVRLENQLILDNLNFSIPPHKICAIIGPNGAGKSVLLKTLLGLIKPERGFIRILNQPIFRIKTQIGYVPQRFSFDKTFPLTVEEFLKLSSISSKYFQEKDILGEVDILNIFKRKIGELSQGQLQRVLIAKALINKPKILFLDEPFTGIDIGGEKNIYELIEYFNRKYKVTVLLVSHEIDIVFRYTDLVLCLNKKLICQGTPNYALNEETLKRLYSTESAIFKHNH